MEALANVYLMIKLSSNLIIKLIILSVHWSLKFHYIIDVFNFSFNSIECAYSHIILAFLTINKLKSEKWGVFIWLILNLIECILKPRLQKLRINRPKSSENSEWLRHSVSVCGVDGDIQIGHVPNPMSLSGPFEDHYGLLFSHFSYIII